MPAAAPIRDVDDPRWVRALSHPLRMRLLAVLEREAASPEMLAERLSQPLCVISYHLRFLKSLELLELVETLPRRGVVERYYRARSHPRFSDAAWAELDVVTKQRIVSSVLNEAHEDAINSAAAGGFDAADAHFTRTPLDLDEEGWTKLAAASKGWLEEAEAIQRESRERADSTGAAARTPAELVVLFFEAPVPCAHAERHHQ